MGYMVNVVGRLRGDTPERVIEYLKKEHEVYLVNPKMAGSEFHDLWVYEDISKIKRKEVDTTIIYMNPEMIKRTGLVEKINSEDVVLPPGADNDEDVIRMIEKKGINVKKECPRVVLSQVWG